jgi:Fe-S oxidoreductase
MSFNLAKCDCCGECFESCHYTPYDRPGAAEQMRKLVAGENAEIITECVTCAACNTYCEKGANPFDLLLMRQEASGLYKTTPSYQALIDTLDQQPGEIIRGKTGQPVINICVVDVIPGIFEGRLFQGCTFLKGGDYESVLGAIHGGTEKPLRDKLAAKISALTETGFNEIVMFHDDCYAAYTTKAIEYGISVPFKVKHYIEYLKDYLIAHKEEIRPLNMNIAYQQPCSSRYTPWMDAHLDELFELCGVKRVQRKYDRRDALCCGSPVGPHAGAEFCAEFKSKNIADAKENHADAMVFMCPFCALQMREEAAEAGLEPIFLTSLVRMALGESLSGHPAGLGDDREMIQAAVKIVKGEM